MFDRTTMFYVENYAQWYVGKLRTIYIFIYLGERQRERQREEEKKKQQGERRGGQKRCGGWRFVIAYSRLLAGRGPLSAFREGALRLPSPLQKPHTNKQENIFNRRQSKMMNWWWWWAGGTKKHEQDNEHERVCFFFLSPCTYYYFK